MGKASADASPAARDVFKRADAALGEPLSRLCFDGPLEELTLTRNTQPALLATSCAITAALIDRFPQVEPPVCAAGHSLGEYSALVASGALDLEEAVRLCRIRGEVMQSAVPEGLGGMAAIMGLDQDAVAAVCAEAAGDEVVSPANYNAPGQIVIAGHVGAVGRATALAGTRGGKSVTLKVSAPFHCALMGPAAEQLALELERVSIRALAFPVIANIDASLNTDPDRVRGLLVRQIDGPVQWVRTIQRMAEEGVTHALEIGPGKVLAGLAKRIAKQITVLGVSDMAGIERAGALLSEG